MKKYIFATIFLSLSLNLNAQSVFDVMRFANNSINGSARYMGMAGSFGAIGGDVSATIDNPAVLGIFRSSEASISLSVMPAKIVGNNWNGDKYSENNATSNCDLNHIAWVFNVPTYNESGYLSSSFGFSYHKIKDFNRRFYTKTFGSPVSLTDLMADYAGNWSPAAFESNDDYDAYENVNLDWLSILGSRAELINYQNGSWSSLLGIGEKVSPSYYSYESGYLGEYNFTYSGNVNDIFYFGLGMSLQNMYYNVQSRYNEDFNNYGFELENIFGTSSWGLNFKFGTIVRATKFMRFGLSFQTPTWHSMTDTQFAKLNSHLATNKEVHTPEFTCNYLFNTPVKAQASVGFIIGKRAAINIDYQLSGKKYTASDGPENFEIDFNKDAKITHAVKLGAEVKLGKYFKIRGGGAFFSAPINQNAVKYYPYPSTRTDMEYFVAKNTYYGTCGAGYAKNHFSIDLAYAYQQQNERFFPAENFENYAKLKTHNHNVVATLAFRY